MKSKCSKRNRAVKLKVHYYKKGIRSIGKPIAHSAERSGKVSKKAWGMLPREEKEVRANSGEYNAP